MADIELGCLAADLVTGFEGIVVGKADYLYGCHQYALTPKAVDGKTQPTEWFDAGRVKRIGDGIEPAAVQAVKPGGPNRDAPRH